MQRHDGGGGKIGVTQLSAGFIEHFSKRQRDAFQMTAQALEIRRRQGIQQVVLMWGLRGQHGQFRAVHPLAFGRGFHTDAAVTDETARLVEHGLSAHPKVLL